MKFTNKLLASVFYWFGLVMAAFGFFTELSGQQIYLSSSFYFNMSVLGFLAAIAVATIERMKE
ncbi:MAG: hypothetical protein HY976_03270 [Candidatus Kerfeldbacteria bacterium]|nr:hypothetical protein [Candidatus Kerfeldbacteria bacterium]